MMWLLLGLLLPFLAYKFWYLPRVKWSRLNVKSTKPLPILGDSFSMITGKEGVFECIQRMYEEFSTERYFGMHQFTQPILVVRDPELLQKIFITDFDHFANHVVPITNDDSFISKMLFILKGNEWRSMRHSMSPTFTISKLRVMSSLLVETAGQVVGYLMSVDTKNVEVMDIVSRYSNDALTNCVFGLRVDSLRDKDNEIYRVTKEFNKSFQFKLMIFTHWPGVVKLLRIKSVSDYNLEFFKNLLEMSIGLRERQKIIRVDLIHSLMAARKHDDRITMDIILSQAVSFFFAGLETTSTVLSFIIYELAINPDIQERLCDEINDALQQNGERVSYDALLKMKYMDMVVSEGLRKYPGAIITDRRCTKSYNLTPSTYIEKNTMLWLPIYAIHRDSRHYPDAERFDPERFSDENRAKIKPGTYIPFGDGPRQCIGSRFAILQMKVALAHLLSKFQIKANNNTQVPPHMQKRSMVLYSEGGIWVTLEKRNRD